MSGHRRWQGSGRDHLAQRNVRRWEDHHGSAPDGEEPTAAAVRSGVGRLHASTQSHHYPVTDFRHWDPWRVLTPVVADELIRFSGQSLVAPQTVLEEDYWDELEAGLSERGHVLLHVLLEAQESTLRCRIEADQVEVVAKLLAARSHVGVRGRPLDGPVAPIWSSTRASPPSSSPSPSQRPADQRPHGLASPHPRVLACSGAEISSLFPVPMRLEIEPLLRGFSTRH